MSRLKTYGLVLALLASAALSTACTRTDTTGPSEQPQASFETIRGQQLGRSSHVREVRPTQAATKGLRMRRTPAAPLPFVVSQVPRSEVTGLDRRGFCSGCLVSSSSACSILKYQAFSRWLSATARAAVSASCARARLLETTQPDSKLVVIVDRGARRHPAGARFGRCRGSARTPPGSRLPTPGP